MTQLSFAVDGAAEEQLGALRAQVILQVEGPLGVLDYSVPAALEQSVHVGTPVQVTLRRRRVRGYVCDLAYGPHPAGIALKPIVGLADGSAPNSTPPLPHGIIRLVEFASRYYHVPPGEMLLAALPSASRPKTRRYRLTEKGRRWSRASAPGEGGGDLELLVFIEQHAAGLARAGVQRQLGCTAAVARATLRRLQSRGFVQPTSAVGGPRQLTTYTRLPAAADVSEKLSPGQQALLAAVPFTGGITAADLAKNFRSVHQKLRRLCALGHLERGSVAVLVRPAGTPGLSGGDVRPTPTPAQQQAMQAIGEALQLSAAGTTPPPLLLQGVTGSGKTEVYMNCIEATLKQGRTALVLVPEIALTPQLSSSFRARFGDQVATFHSGLTVAERRDEWERVRSGAAAIGVGARSAVFLPLENLGLLVVDEEHESSFKQDENPRYNARDLAIYRAHEEGGVVVLGSATPSLESWHRARKGEYRHLRLPERVESRPMPQVITVQMAGVERRGEGIFSETLAAAVEETLAAGEQVILFLNRRGFAPYVFCKDCGYAFRCDDCDISLTLHRGADRLICHHCAFETPIADVCPDCEGKNIEAHGLGTERLQAEVESLFGDVRIARLDRDTVQRRKDLLATLGGFRRGETRILIGTQMVTKGHDFPGVTLVGVMNADAALNFPDFRAAERTFQILTQVAGRAGRGDRPGRVLVQTYAPEHPAIQAVVGHDYEAFALAELAHRSELHYPPVSHLALLRFSAPEEGEARAEAMACAASLRTPPPDTAASSWPSLLGPAPAPLQRLRGQWRVNLLLKAAKREHLHRALATLPKVVNRGVVRVVDVDPLHLL